MKKYITLVLFSCAIFTANAQLCQPSTNCDEAPVLCGALIDGLVVNMPFPSFPPPPIPSFCGTLENSLWLGFVPCEPSVTFQIAVGNCLNPPPQFGMQAAIVAMEDCVFPQVIGCNEQILPGAFGIVGANGLIPGEVYYLLLDGYNGDVCDLQIFVEEGVNTIDPDYEQTEPGFIDGPTDIPCPAGFAEYTAVLPVCEAQNNTACTTPAPMDDCVEIIWTLPPGATFVGDSTGLTIIVDLSNASSGELSVEFDIAEACECYCELCLGDEIPPIFINIQSPVFTTLPPLEFCSGDEFVFCGTTYTVENDDVFTCQIAPCIFTQQPVTVIPGVEVDISQTGNLEDDLFVLLENIFFQSGAPETYFWEGPGISAGNENEYTQEVAEVGIYTLTVTDSLTGCTAQAQTPVLPGSLCSNLNSPVPPSDDCTDAPPFCEAYLNGYCSVNSFNTGDTPGDLASVMSCQIENNQWLSFRVCESEASIEIAVSNCLGASGLEISVLQSSDCQSFNPIVNCTEIADGNDAVITLTGLNPGEEYLLMIDGIGGDICQWQVLATSGISAGLVFQEDNMPGHVFGPSSMCTDMPIPLSFDFVPAICDLIPMGGCPAEQLLCEPHIDTCHQYRQDTIWHITPPGILLFVDNDSIGAPIDVYLSPDTILPPGISLEFVISVELVLVPIDTFPCFDDCLEDCVQIIPDTEPCEITPLIFTLCTPDINFEIQTICPGECVDFMGETFCGEGTYSVFNVDNVCGCEDEYILELIEEPFPIPPIVTSPIVDCAPDGMTYTVSFELVGGSGFFTTTINGTPLSGSTFTSGPIPSGDAYNFEIISTDFICGFTFFDEVSGTHECECESETYELGLISLCEGDCYDIMGNMYCDPGVYNELIFNPLTNCDDTYIFEIIINESETFELGLIVICEGDCYDIAGNQYCDSGTYNEQILNPITNCFDTYIFEIEFNDESALLAGSVTELCNFTNTEYTVFFTIDDGVAPYFVDGVMIVGNSYESGPYPSGSSYFFQITDSGACGANELNIEGEYTCACITDPGTMEQALLATCEEEMVSAIWNNDATLDADDILVYVLHTASGTLLGDVLGTNTTGTFGFEPGTMEYGVTYFISAVAGNDNGGNVDFSDACFAASAGQPVIFYENPELDILPVDMLTCDVTAVPLDAFPMGGSGDFEYLWMGPGLNTSGQNAIATQPGTFSCVLTDVLSGCTAIASIEVESDDQIPVFQVIPPSGELTCDVESISLETSSAQLDLTFEWTLIGGATVDGTTITVDESGDYVVVATAPNGCTSEVVVEISENITPPENLISTDGLITCDQPFATLEVSSSTADVEFNWIFPLGNESMGASIITDIPGQYTVTATGQNGCTSVSQSILIEDNEPPSGVAANDATFDCDQQTATLEGISSTPGVSYSWVFPSGDQMDGQSISTNIAGDYTLIVTGPNGCTAEAQSTVIDASEPPENVTATEGELTCDQQTTMLEASSSTPDVTYVWVFPAGDEMDGQNISTNVAGSYILIATAPNGCTAQVTTLVIDSSDPPTVNATDGEVNCEQPDVTLQAGSDMPGSIFTWTLPNGTMADGASLNTSLPGGYIVTVLAPNGCETIVETEVLAVPDPEITAQLDIQMPTCAGDADGSLLIEMMTGGNAPYDVTLDGEPLIDNALENMPAGIYQLAITDANGCTGEELVTVPNPDEVTANLGDDLFIELGEEVVLTLQTDIIPAAINWSGPNGQTWTGVSSVTIGPTTNGTYSVIITDLNDCTAEADIQIFVKGEGTVFVPNIFSPNGDGVNDLVTVFAGSDVALVRSFSIYNRWGDLVYQGENFPPETTNQAPSTGWDGKLKGKPLDPAVFVYVAEVEFLTGESKILSGDVVLIR